MVVISFNGLSAALLLVIRNCYTVGGWDLILAKGDIAFLAKELFFEII
jgi:hypothetical protein